MNAVPNQFPTVSSGSLKLACIGESPSLEEQNWAVCPAGHEYSRKKWRGGQMIDVIHCPGCCSACFTARPTPFVGPSGQLLNDTLALAGIRREQCYVGNVSQVPLGEAQFSDSPHVAEGMRTLRDELSEFKPNCVLLLGNQALRAFHPWHWRSAVVRVRGDPRQTEMLPEFAPGSHATVAKGQFAAKITDWRGSIFEGEGFKCVAAYHPAAVLRQIDWRAILRFDVARAVKEAEDPALNLPQRRVNVPRDAGEAVGYLDTLRASKARLGFDLEGWAASGVTVCSFAKTPDEAFVIPLRHISGVSWWTPEDESRVVQALRRLLEDREVPKVMHNALYELLVMRWHYGIVIRGIGGDTMLKWHEAFAELDKALEVPVSVLSRQPYWKYGRDAATDDELIAYNATDTCVTIEIDAGMNYLDPPLTPGQRAHYEFNLSLLEPMAAQMFTGIRFDVAARAELVARIRAELFDLQGKLDKMAKLGRPSLADCAEVVCYGKKQAAVGSWEDLVKCAKPSWQKPYEDPLTVEEEP